MQNQEGIAFADKIAPNHKNPYANAMPLHQIWLFAELIQAIEFPNFKKLHE